MAVEIGGFYSKLRMEADQTSFDKSKKELKGVEDQTKKTGLEFGKFVGDVIKGFTLIGGAAMGAAYAVSNIQGKMALTAKNAGMGYTELNKWSTAMKLVGLDSTTLANKMSSVNEALADYKVGENVEAYQSLAESLAKLTGSGSTGININDFEKMSATERIMAVTGRAESARGTDKERAMLDLADKILGVGDMLQSETMAGSKYKTTAQLLAASAGKQMLTAGDMINGVQNSQAFNSFTASMEQVWNVAGNSLATSFRPIIEGLTKFIDEHGPEIKKFFDNLGSLIANFVELLGPAVGTLLDITGKAVDMAATMQDVSKFDKSNPASKAAFDRALASLGIDNPYSSIQSKGDTLAHNTGLAFNPITRKQAGDVAGIERLAIGMLGKSYAEAPTAQERALTGTTGSTSINVGNINLTGDALNRFINYMAANPDQDKSIAALSAFAAAQMVSSTK